MKTESRQIAIYNMVKSNREMSVNALAECFGVSPMTIRRDLDNLEHAKLIHRAYGKAFIANEDGSEMAFVLREASNLELKQKIAQTARRYLTGINSLYVDGSSTAHELIKILPTDRSYTIFTNSVATLLLLQQKEWITTFVIGGFLCDDNNTLDDSTSAEIAKRIFVDATSVSYTHLLSAYPPQPESPSFALAPCSLLQHRLPVPVPAVPLWLHMQPGIPP